MRRVTDIVAKALSVLLYPLFVPTYGIALFCWAYHTQVNPLSPVWSIIAIVGTFLLTCLIPMSAIWIRIKRGVIKDIQIENSEQRTVPYLYAALGFVFWAYLMIAILHAPLYLDFIALGATAAIGLITLINRWWKISAHLTGMGGLTGGLFAYCLGIGALPTVGTICLWFGLTLALMYARIYLKAHTASQVSAGWLMGLTCTFLPYCIYVYAQ